MRVCVQIRLSNDLNPYDVEPGIQIPLQISSINILLIHPFHKVYWAATECQALAKVLETQPKPKKQGPPSGGADTPAEEQRQ